MNLSLWNRWVTALDAADIGALAQLVAQHPDWRLRSSGDGNPLIRAMTLQDLDPAAHRRVLGTLVHGLGPDALAHRPEPLWMAADNGWDWAVETLLPLSDPNALHQGSPPLVRAAALGYTGVVAQLIPRSDPNRPGEDGITALMRLAQDGHTDSMAALLDRPDRAIDQRDHQGRSALLWAAGKNQARALVLLLAHGADPNVADHQGWNALSHAAAQAHGTITTRMMNHHRLQRTHGQPGLHLQHRDENGRFAEDLVAVNAPSCSPAFRQTLAQRLREDRIAEEREALRSSLDGPTPLLTAPGEGPRPRSRL